MATELSPGSLLDLQTALSPAFPVGAFAYSHGLERAVHDGWVSEAATLEAWLRDLIEHGSGWNDAVLLAAAWRGEAVGELALALAPSVERWRETALQGEAFGLAAEAWSGEAGEALPYPAAVGRFAAMRGLPLEAVLAAFLQAFAANLVQVALRLMRLGQTGGLRVLASLKPVVLATAARAMHSTLDDLGSAAILSDIASLRHEAQYSRIFRS